MKRLLTAALILIAATAAMARAHVPSEYPATYAEIVASAKQEGKVVVYSVTSSVPLLVQDFRSLYLHTAALIRSSVRTRRHSEMLRVDGFKLGSLTRFAVD